MKLEEFIQKEIEYRKTDIFLKENPEKELRRNIRELVKMYSEVKYPYNLTRRATYVEKWTEIMTKKYERN